MPVSVSMRVRKRAAVFGFAHGGGADRENAFDAAGFHQRREAAQRLHRRRRRQPWTASFPCAQIAAEAGHHLFIEDRRHRAAIDAVDDQAHRVGADIDDGGVLAVAKRALPRPLTRSPRYLKRAPIWSNATGALPLSARPRPDRLGLRMKYSCAENGSSGSLETSTRLKPPSASMYQLCASSLRFATMI